MEHLETIEINLINLEQAPEDKECINAIFRPFHTIKGVSGFLNLQEIHKFSHAVESLLDDARNDNVLVNQKIIDLILEAVDFLKTMILDQKGFLVSGKPQPKRKIIRVGEKQFTVQIEGNGHSILCEEDGKEVLVPLEEYKQRLAARLVEEAPSVEDLRNTWVQPEQRGQLLVSLPGGEGAVRLIRELEDEKECDLFDVLAELGYGLPPKSRMERAAAFSYKNKVWLRGFPERTGKVLTSIARQFEKGGIEELETTHLFDEDEVVQSGGFDALVGLSLLPQVLVQETKARLLA
jgi:chemotaxis protein histidine kinase CheA